MSVVIDIALLMGILFLAVGVFVSSALLLQTVVEAAVERMGPAARAFVWRINLPARRRMERGTAVVDIAAMAALASGDLTDDDLWAVYDVADRELGDSKIGWNAVESLKAKELQLTHPPSFQDAVARRASELDQSQRERVLAYVATMVRQGCGFRSPASYRDHKSVKGPELITTLAAALGIDTARCEEVVRESLRLGILDTRQLPSKRPPA